MSVCRHEITREPLAGFSTTLMSENICEELLGDFDFHLDQTNLTTTLYEDPQGFLLVSRA
jgi:hypothetical protein